MDQTEQNKSVEPNLFDQQIEFALLHPEFRNFIPTIMGVHSAHQAEQLQDRFVGPEEAYMHIFEGTGASKTVLCKWCANELKTRMEQRKAYL